MKKMACIMVGIVGLTTAIVAGENYIATFGYVLSREQRNLPSLTLKANIAVEGRSNGGNLTLTTSKDFFGNDVNYVYLKSFRGGPGLPYERGELHTVVFTIDRQILQAYSVLELRANSNRPLKITSVGPARPGDKDM